MTTIINNYIKWLLGRKDCFKSTAMLLIEDIYVGIGALVLLAVGVDVYTTNVRIGSKIFPPEIETSSLGDTDFKNTHGSSAVLGKEPIIVLKIVLHFVE